MTKAPISCGILAAIALVWTVAAQAQDSASRKPGTVTGLPIPRFVSLKASEVNARVGPGPDYQIAWVFKRAGLPVEVLAEFESWRQVRDSDGVTGWVAAPLLSARRTAIVAPWIKEHTVFALTSSRGGSSGWPKSSPAPSWTSWPATEKPARSMQDSKRAGCRKKTCGEFILAKR